MFLLTLLQYELKLEEQQSTFQEETRKSLENRTAELQKLIRHAELKVIHSEQSLAQYKDIQTEATKINEVNWTKKIDDIKIQHNQEQDKIKEVFKEKIKDAREQADQDAKSYLEKNRQSMDETTLLEQNKLSSQLQFESNKCIHLQKTIDNMIHQQNLKMQSFEEKNRNHVSKLQQEWERKHKEKLKELEAKLDQARHDLQEERALVKNFEVLAASEASRVSQSLQELKLLRQPSQEDIEVAHIGVSQMLKDTGLSKDLDDSAARQSHDDFISVRVRMTDIVHELETTNSLELNEDITGPFAFMHQLLITPGHFDAMFGDEADVWHGNVGLSSEAGLVEQQPLPLNPFGGEGTVQDHRSTHKEASPGLRELENLIVVPFNPNPSHKQPIRTSSPVSSTGSTGIVSVLDEKVDRRNAASQKSHFRVSSLSLESAASISRPMVSRGVKRVALSNNRAPGKKQSVNRVNSTSAETRSSSQASLRNDGFEVIGGPHSGQFGYNRPPTAMSNRSRISNRRVLKRSEMVMVAQFDQ
jgi:hypothetical protein